ncbi:MAG: Holliday junction DNA helicase RuvA [Desulfobacteraceae bacterium]|nr:Holliday junction DNA helicase RuvA [Desulfobacteraceae bacterium]MBC2754137.1 Holliday junction DNA helicase RuvA [Desulfobacteraceae bacterium]
MIAYLEGTLLKKEADRIILLANQVGYEVLVPLFVMETISVKSVGDTVSLFIYYHQTERQPKPVLIGFHLEAEREFFQMFISVEAIGPLKAIKALNLSVRDIARAIESKNLEALKRLNGIGDRTARKIIATLQGKMGKFALIRDEDADKPLPSEDFVDQVIGVLVDQLGHKMPEAKQMVQAAMKRKPLILNPEDLFDEVYRGEMLNE